MDNPKIRIESDGIATIVYLNGERVRCTSLDFHGDVAGGIHVEWDGIFIKEDENGKTLIENGEVVTEEFHYGNREVMGQ